jgi:hypothetical protein
MYAEDMVVGVHIGRLTWGYVRLWQDTMINGSTKKDQIKLRECFNLFKKDLKFFVKTFLLWNYIFFSLNLHNFGYSISSDY